MPLSLKDRVRLAVMQDRSVIASPSTLDAHPGFAVSHFIDLGLTKADLKKLERKGLARRGYMKNTWLAGETLPSGKVVPKGRVANASGHRVRWVLFAPGGDVLVEATKKIALEDKNG